MIRLVRTLAADERGASIIELALVAPVFASLLIGMVDISRAYSSKLQLEQAAQRAIEKVQQYQTTSSTYDTLRTEAATAAGITATTSNPTVRYWLQCDSNARLYGSASETNCTGTQTYQRYVEVTVTKPFTPMFGTRFFPRANSDGTYTLSATAALRTQ
jgi:Flp pilus assembly protein TadG